MKKDIDNNFDEDYILDEATVSEDISDKDSLKKLRDKLKVCVKEKQDYLDGWQRAKADFINYKKEEETRLKDVSRFAKENVILEILPVIDSFAMAEASSSSNDGLSNIFKQFLSILKRNGLEEMDPKGQDFNPSFHEAIEMVSSEKENEGKVVEVVQKGYLLNGKIIRPARVKVGS
jgi:molecular chaperone GrpE